MRPRLLRLLLAVTAALAAPPALAEGQRDAFGCVSLSTCVPGAACTEGGADFGLAFLGGGLEVTMGGETLHPAYDGILRTAAWAVGGRVWQIHFTGDGAGVLMSSAEDGAPGDSALMTIHCSPE